MWQALHWRHGCGNDILANKETGEGRLNMNKSLAIVLMFLFWTFVAMCGYFEATACEVSRYRINNSRYVLHDMNCDGITDTVFEYYWDGSTFIFLGTYPYSAFK